MKFSAVALLLPVAALASPFALERRADNYATILKDLQQLAKDIVAENTTLNGFANSAQPTVAQQVALAQGANTISSDLNQTTVDATSSSAGTSTESTNIYNYLSGTVYTDTTQLLNNFIAHYVGLKAAKLQPIVESNLQKQKNQTDALGAALAKIATGPSASKAAALQAKFDAAFNTAIKKFSS